MTGPDTARAFAAAEAAYLEPPTADECTCDLGDYTWCVVHGDDDWDEHEWEMRQDAKEAREGL